MSKDENKYPFLITEHYSPGLNSLKRIYTQHPKFSGNERLIYELLFDYWNPEQGYAWPTISRLSLDSGLGTTTVKRCIGRLKELDLIAVNTSDVSNNNTYIVKQPVTTMTEFIAKFPEVKAIMDKRQGGVIERESIDKQRLRESASKRAGSAEVTAEVIDW